MENSQRNDPFWLGFVERPDWIEEITGADTRGYTILLPADRPRHVKNSHEFDGKGQRDATPDDYAHLEDVLNDPDTLKPGTTTEKGAPTVVARKSIKGEVFVTVWQVLKGKRNKSLQLVSLSIKTPK